LSEKFAQGFTAAGGDEEGGRYGKVIEIPLRDAGAALASAERDFDECRVTFVALGAHLVAEDGAEELQRVWFVANADVVDRFLRIHRRIVLDGGELAAEQSQGIWDGHADTRSGQAFDHFGSALLLLRERDANGALQQIVE